MMSDERKEIYDLVDANDSFVEIGTYADARTRKLYTRSVHILLSDANGKVLVCKRAASKQTYPNLITSSAGGHVDAGETYEQAAYRELNEELSIRVQLFDCGRFDVVNESERTIHRLYAGKITQEAVGKMRFDPEEVASHSYKQSSHLVHDSRKCPAKYAPPFRAAIELFTQARTYVIDFDHTLFDWYAFKADLQEALAHEGVLAHLFSEAQASQEARDGLYHVEKHLEELPGISLEKARNILNLLLRRGSRYIFPDARDFLRKIRKERVHAVLLTYGDAENQNLFIRATGIGKYFERIVCVKTKEDKVQEVERIQSKAPGVLFVINDDPLEALTMAPSLLPTTRSYLIERPMAKFTSIEPRANYILVRDLTDVS